MKSNRRFPVIVRLNEHMASDFIERWVKQNFDNFLSKVIKDSKTKLRTTFDFYLEKVLYKHNII